MALKCRVRSCQRAHPIGGKRRSHATCGLRLRRDVLQLEHEAAELLRQGLSLDPGSRIFQANFVHVYRQWTEALCREGRFDQAARALELARAVRPEEDQLAVVRQEVDRRWELARLEADQARQAMALGLGLGSSGSLPTALPVSADGP